MESADEIRRTINASNEIFINYDIDYYLLYSKNVMKSNYIVQNLTNMNRNDQLIECTIYGSRRTLKNLYLRKTKLIEVQMTIKI